MRTFLFLIAILIVGSFADSGVSYLLGMRNSRYMFVGAEFGDAWGADVEHSVFTQGLEKQYARIASFYHWTAPWNIYGNYAVYAGMRYDKDYYDFGAKMDIMWALYQYVQFAGVINPFYDSFLKDKLGYEGLVQSFLLEEVGLFVGVKNLPFFRDTERRYVGGLIFNTGNILVKPELSVPSCGGSHLTRVSLFFVYKKLI